jgi:hypothetical protein
VNTNAKGWSKSCSTGFDTEFFAIVSPTWEDQKLHDLDQPFAFVFTSVRTITPPCLSLRAFVT